MGNFLKTKNQMTINTSFYEKLPYVKLQHEHQDAFLEPFLTHLGDVSDEQGESL